MQVAISEAKSRLTDLVRRAEAGDEIVLTRHGQPAVKLVPVAPKVDRERRRAVLEEIIKTARERGPDGGPCAARSQDWLYDENGLPA